jgi:hypothetical protein
MKSKGKNHDSLENPQPLSEKDEVKAAEKRTRQAAEARPKSDPAVKAGLKRRDNRAGE